MAKRYGVADLIGVGGMQYRRLKKKCCELGVLLFIDEHARTLAAEAPTGFCFDAHGAHVLEHNYSLKSPLADAVARMLLDVTHGLVSCPVGDSCTFCGDSTRFQEKRGDRCLT